MKWLVLVHVLTAIIGIGPTYFGHVLCRGGQRVGELRRSLELFGFLNFFPKIGGTIAVLSGLLLVWLDGWKFASFWIIGSLALYVAIQIVVVGLLGPMTGKLQKLISDPALKAEQELPAESAVLLAKVNVLFYVASALGLVLFAFMIMKP
ncbi:DUF2269 family protein [Cohnella soli]|uniref:DUF2269 family protein n=1 Tax=Cohnella soli TaxID=425005 RepID=A0ABW0HXT5_9BACL